jgi:hypothetical protein
MRRANPERLNHSPDRNAEVGATGALRFHLELVDARQVGGAHPEILRVRADAIERDGAIVIEDSGGRRRRCGKSYRRSGGSEKEVTAEHPLYNRSA